jgi:hypothetical protein
MTMNMNIHKSMQMGITHPQQPNQCMLRLKGLKRLLFRHTMCVCVRLWDFAVRQQVYNTSKNGLAILFTHMLKNRVSVH